MCNERGGIQLDHQASMAAELTFMLIKVVNRISLTKLKWLSSSSRRKVNFDEVKIKMTLKMMLVSDAFEYLKLFVG